MGKSMIPEFPVLICSGKANSCGNGCVQGWCQCLTHMNWCSTDAWPDYKPCWQPVSTSLACPPALGFAYVFAQGRSLWCLLKICTPSAPILGYMIKVVYCGSTVFSTVAVLCAVLWQYCSQYCGSTVFSTVAVLWSVLWQYCSQYCHSTVLSTATVLFSVLWQYCSQYCHSTVFSTVAVLLSVLWQYCSQCCHSTVFSIATVLFSVLWQYCSQYCH